MPSSARELIEEAERPVIGRPPAGTRYPPKKREAPKATATPGPPLIARLATQATQMVRT
jgi:hypothetical protein